MNKDTDKRGDVLFVTSDAFGTGSESANVATNSRSALVANWIGWELSVECVLGTLPGAGVFVRVLSAEISSDYGG